MRGESVGAADEGGDGVLACEGFSKGEGAGSAGCTEEEDAHWLYLLFSVVESFQLLVYCLENVYVLELIFDFF